MRLTTILFCMVLATAAMAQQPKAPQYTMTKEQLEAEKKKIIAEIRENEAQLEIVKNKKGATMAELRVLQNQLAERQRLIGSINGQLSGIDRTIKQSSKEVGNLKLRLDQQKVRYAQSLRYAYQTRSSYDMLAFLFSSRDFNDAMRRMKYLKKFRDFRRDQVNQIHSTQDQLQNKIGKLNADKEELENRQKEKLEQTEKLRQETDLQQQKMQELKGQESELLRNIEKNRAVANRVNKAIERYIQMEMEKARKAAEEEERKRLAEASKNAPANPANPPAHPGSTNNPPASGPPPGTAPTSRPRPTVVTPDVLLTPTEEALASSFEGSKGRLNWPVDKGYISDHFGTHPHPAAPKVMIDNAGIDIQTSENAPVKAVFEGTVTKVFSTLGSAQIVMITHGNYFTVYNGLTNVTVREGQAIKARQVLGTAALNDENVPTINFQIWKSGAKKTQVKLNPEQWIGKGR